MELEKRLRGRRDDSLDPVFVPMKKELLGHMAAEEKLAVPAPRPGDAAADAGRSAGARGGTEAPRAPHGQRQHARGGVGASPADDEAGDRAPRPGRGEQDPARCPADRRRSEAARARGGIQADGRAVQSRSPIRTGVSTAAGPQRIAAAGTIHFFLLRRLRGDRDHDVCAAIGAAEPESFGEHGQCGPEGAAKVALAA